MNIAPAFANKYMLKISGTAVGEEIVALGTATKITCLDGLRYSFLLSSDGTIPAGMRLVRRGKNLLIEVDGQIVLVLVNFYSVNGTSFVVDAAGDTVTAETDKLRALTDSDDLIWVAQDPKGGLFGGAGGMGAALAGLAIAASAGGSTPENVVVGGLDVDSVTDRYLSDGKALIITLPANATAGQTIRVKVYLDSGLVDTIEHILTSGDIANGSVQINLPADDITVDLGTYSATIDLLNGATLLNTTTIDNVYVNDGDNGMSLALDGDTNPYDGLNCVITLPSSALAGDTIRTLIYIEGSFDPVGTVETVLTADDITAGVLHQLMTVLDVSRDAQYNGQSLCLAPDGSQRESTEADGLFTIYDGLVVDDYLAGAQVFIDRNRNNQWDSNEEIATTDEEGHFFFMVSPDGAPILAVGGVDAASGSPNSTIVYRAFSTGSAAAMGIDIVLSPLSTLIASIADAIKGGSGAPLTEAELLSAADIARDALGLDPNLSGADLLRVDPIASTLSGTASDSDIAIIAANRQLAVLLSSVAALINGASFEGTNDGSNYAAQSLAELIIRKNDLGDSVSLSDAADIEDVFLAAMEGSNTDANTTDLRTTNPEDLGRIAQIVSTFNNRIESGTTSGSGPMSDDARAAMRTAYDLIVPMLERAGAEASTDRGGDVSLTLDANELQADLTLPGGIDDLIDNAIAQVMTNLNSGFETNTASGSTGQYLPLDIQLPALPFGSTINAVVLSGLPDAVGVYLVNPITLEKTLLVADQDGNYVLSSPSQLGYLYVKSDTSATFEMDLSISGVKADATPFAIEGNCPIEFLSVDVIPKATITGIFSDNTPDKVAVDKDGTTEDPSPRIEGTLNQDLTSGQRVAIYVDGVYLGDAQVIGTSWVFADGIELTNGRTSIVARVIDGSDTDISASFPYSVTIDAPVTTAILSTVTDDYNAGPATTLSEDATPTFEGTFSLPLTQGQQVAVYDGATLLGYATVDGNTWSFTPKTPLQPGAHSFTIVIQDSDDSVVSTSEPVTLTIDPPSAPANPSTPALGPNGDTDSNPTDGVTSVNPPPILIGPLAHGMIDVVVLVDGETVEGLYDAVTGVFTPTDPLPAGDHDFSYQFVDQYGIAGGASTPLSLTLVEIPLAILSTVTDDYNAGPATTLSEDATPSFEGSTSVPLRDGQKVAVYDGATLLGYATVDGDTWSFTPKTPLQPGAHSFTIVIQDSDDSVVSTSEPVTLTIDPPSAPANPSTPALGPNGDTDSNPTDGVTSVNPPPILIGPLAHGMMDVIVLVDGEPVEGLYDAVTGVFTPTDPLPAGDHDFSYQFVDQYGIAGGASTPLSLTLVEIPLAILSTVTDDYNAGPATTLSEDATPSFEGSTSVPLRDGQKVAVYDGASLLGYATVDGDTWSFTPKTPLQPGEHSFTIVIQDSDDSVVSTSEPATLTIDPPSAPANPSTPALGPNGDTDSNPTDGVTSVNPPPILIGPLAHGMIDVIVLVDGEPVEGLYDAVTGVFTPTDPLPAGDHDFSYQFVDQYSIAGGASTPLSLTLVDPTFIFSIQPTSELSFDTPLAGGTTEITFTVMRTDSSSAASVDWTASGLSVEMLALIDAAGTVAFAAGVSSAQISILVPVNAAAEIVQTLSLHLSNATGGFWIDQDNDSVSAKILDASISTDLSYSTFAISSSEGLTIDEGAAGTSKTIVYTVTRLGKTEGAADITWALRPSGQSLVGSDDFAGQGSQDYLEGNGGLPNGAIRFADGETSKTFQVVVQGDNNVGPNESYSIALRVPDGDKVSGNRSTMIQSDDANVSVSLTAGPLPDEVLHSFVITRSGATAGTHSVSYSISPAGELGQDNLANVLSSALSGTVTFAPGQTEQTVIVTRAAAALIGSYQTFALNLTADEGSNVSIVNATAQSSLIPNQQDITLKADLDRVLEGTAANSAGEFVYIVTRSGRTDLAADILWSINGHGESPATANDFPDGLFPSGTAHFEQGATTAQIRFSPAPDNNLDGEEGFLLQLASENPAIRLLDQSIEGVIVDDESAVGFDSTIPFSVTEGDSGTSVLIATVVRIGFAGAESSVQWRVTQGDANLADFAAGQDLLGDNNGYPSGILTLLPGEISAIARIRIATDWALESAEVFQITLSQPSPNTKVIGQDVLFAGYADTAFATIENDDSVLSMKQDSYIVTEGDGGSSAMMEITVVREGSTVGSDWVNWNLSSKGSAPADGADIGNATSGLSIFNSPNQSWITLSQISGVAAESGSFDLPRSGYLMVAYNRGQSYTDPEGINLPFDRFLLNALSVTGDASLTILGDVTQQNFIADDVALDRFSGALFTSDAGYDLPNLVTGGNKVVITSDDHMGGVRLRVTGLDVNGDTISETIFGPNQGAVSTSGRFASVLSVEAVETRFDLGRLFDARAMNEPDFYDVNDGDPIDMIVNGSVSTLGTQDFYHWREIANADVSNTDEPFQLTIRTEADLTGSQVIVYGGMTVAMFDRGFNGFYDYENRRTTTNDSGDEVRFDTPQHIRAEQLGARYQGNDDSNAASSFVVSGRDVNGNAIVETVTVPEAAPNLFATLTTIVAGAIQIAQPIGMAAGRVTFLARDTIDDEINYGEDLHFTVTGLDANGAVITELVEVNRWNSDNINATVQDFASITSITSDGGFIGNLSIGLNHPVFTQGQFISVEAVVPVDENGNAYENPYYDIDYGRFEFSADMKIVVEGGPAGLLVVPGLLNYVRGIELRNDSLQDASFDIGFEVPRESVHVLTMSDFVTWGAGEFAANDVEAITIENIGGRIEVNQGTGGNQQWVVLDGNQLDIQLLQAGAYRLVGAKAAGVTADPIANLLDNLANGYELGYDDLYSDGWNDAGNDLYDGGNYLSIDGQQQYLWNTDNNPDFTTESFGQYRVLTGTSGTALVIQNFSASEFSISGNLGADYNGVEELGLLSGMPDGIKVIYDRVYVDNGEEPSLHKLFITNASAPKFTGSTDNTDDEYVSLSNLGDATFMCYMTLVTNTNSPISDADLRDMVLQFLVATPVQAKVETSQGDLVTVSGGADLVDTFASSNMLSHTGVIGMSSQIAGTQADTAYAIVRINAPTADAENPVTVQFDMQVLGRVGLDSAAISYAPDGQWSVTGVDATDSASLILPTLTTELVWSTPSLENLLAEIPGWADGLYIEAVTSGRLEVESEGEWISYQAYLQLTGEDYFSFEALQAAIDGGELRMSAGGVTLQAAFAEDGDWDDREAMTLADPTARAPEPATAVGTTLFNESGYLWLRYTNAEAGFEGSDSATVNSLYVTGGGSLNLVGQKVITQGVAQTQMLQGAMDVALNGSATHAQSIHLGDYEGDLIAYVSRDLSVSHLRNGTYEVTGRNANGVTVTIQGGWTTTDMSGGSPKGQADGTSIVLNGLRGLVSIDRLRLGEYNYDDAELADWDNDSGSPYMLSTPILSVTSGSLDSLSTGFEIESIDYVNDWDLSNSLGWNSSDWYQWSVDVENTNIPGGPIEYSTWQQPLGTQSLAQGFALGVGATSLALEWSDDTAARMTLSSRSDLQGRSFVISGYNGTMELITETITFGADTHFATSQNRFTNVTSIESLAGDKTGFVNVSAEGAMTDGISRALVSVTKETDQPSFAIAGLDANGVYVERIVENLGVNKPLVLGMFSTIFAVQPLQTMEEVLFRYFEVGSLDDLYVDIPLTGARDNAGMIDLGGAQRITIGTGDSSHQNIYRVIGVDAQGNRIEEVISNIAHGSYDTNALEELDGSDLDYHSGVTGVFAITTQYFAKVLSVSMNAFHISGADDMSVGSVGTVGAPLLADTAFDRFGAQFDLGAPIAEFETASKVSFKSDDNLSNREFSVTGRLANGTVITEKVTGPNHGIVLTQNSFVSVSHIAASNGSDGAIKVGYQTSAGGLIDNFTVTGTGTAADPFVAHSINTIENGTNGVTTAGESVSEADILFYLDTSNAAGAVTLHYDLAMQGSAGTDTLTFEYSSNVLTLLSGRATFEDDQAEITILIPVMGDDRREADEQMTLTLGSSSAGTSVDAAANRSDLTILNTDDAVTLSTTSVSGAEGNSAGGSFTFFATRLDDTQPKDVRWSIEGLGAEGTASAEDFDAISGVFTFAQGSLTASITVQLVADRKFEADESFLFVLSQPSLGSGYSIEGNGAASGVIINDDARVSIRVSNSALTEGDTGTVQHVFTILREGDLSQTSTLDYAVTGLDYVNTSPAIASDFGSSLPFGEITFAAGMSGSQNTEEKTITINSAGNTNFSGDVAFRVTLSNDTDDTTDISTAFADGQIIEDDPISVIASDLQELEGTDENGPTTIEYTVARTGDLSREVTLNWTAILAQGSTASQDDFPDGLPSGTVTFLAGESTAKLSLSVTADAIPERDETFTLRFSTDYADVDSKDLTATIMGDDVGFSIETNVTEVIEGNTVNPTIMVTFIRAGNSTAEASYDWSITGVATDNSYPALESNFANAWTGNIAFALGESSKTIAVEIAANSQYDDQRSFQVNLLDSDDAVLTSSATLTIQNDDSSISIIAENSTMNEGSDNLSDALYSSVTYTIFREGNLDQISVVDWRLAAKAGINLQDFGQVSDGLGDNNGLPSGTATFDVGVSSMSITLPIRRDSTYEANEDYEIRLSNASSGSAVDADFASALTTVFNDDAGIQFSQTTLANSATIAEGDQDKGAAFVDLIGDDTQYTTISYTVERVGNTLVQSTVTWALTYLDGANEADFVLPISRELSFGTSDTDPQTIDIKVRKDLLAEGNERFTLTLSTESVGSSAEVNHVVTTTIIDNDEGLRLLGGQSARKHVNEGQTANTELSWTLERTGDLSAALDVSYIVTGKSVYEVLPDIYGWLPEASGNDFVGGTYPSGTIHFDAGASTALVKVAVQADLDIETSEAFQIVLTPQRKIDQLSVHEEGYATALGYLNNDTQQSLEGVILRDEAIVAITEELTSDTDFSTRGLNSAQAEGDSDVSYVSHFFKVFRSLTQSGEVTVDWNVESSGGETKVDSPLFVHDQVVGASSADFVLKPGQLANGNGLPSGTAVISDGQEYVLVEIRTAGNDVAADSKKFKVVLSNVSEGSTINQNNDAHIGEGFIENDDPLFSLGLITPSGDSAITSGSRVWTESDGEITYRIYRTGDTAGAALVDYAITFPIVASRPNSAALNTDFAASAADFDTVSAPLSGTVSFADGQEFVNLTFKLANETLAENFAETFNLSLSDPRWDIGETSTKTLGISSVAGSMTQVILDDDIGSRVAVTAVSSESGGGLTFYEGTAVSAKTVTYTLTRTGDDLSMGQIAWQIVGRNTVNVTGDTLSSITQGFGDGTLVRRGLVSFAQGETVKTITLTLANDNEVASDAQINFELFDARQILRNGISLQNNWGQDINGDIGIYLGDSGAANDTGLLPESGSIIRDETANAIAVNLRNDDTRVIVNSVINYSPAISVWEPDSGTRAITLNLTREGNLEHDLTLAYDIVTNGTADSDDVVVKTGTFTLAAGTDLASNGSKSYSFDLDILKGDVAREADENFTIRLSNIETNAIETAYFYQNWSKTDSIDVAVTVKTNDVTWTALAEVTELVELNSTFSVYSFTISRPEGNGNYSGPAIIAWQVAGMGDHPATVSDFYGYDNVMPAGNVTFVTGEYTKTITIKVAGDNQVEHNETFTIGLVSADVGQIDATTTTMKIRNNDTGISISDVGVLEGDAGTATMTFTVTRSGNLTQDAFAKWATTLDGTAAPTDLADLLSGAGDLIFDAVVTDYAQQGDAADYGEQTQQVTVTVKGDTLGEADETLSVRLSSLQNVNESIDLLGRGTIFNDDTRFSIEAGPSVYEGDPVGQMFIIRRDRLTYQDQTLNWSISTESGSHGADAADLSGGAGSSTLLTNSVTFHAGELEKIVYVKTVADDVAETNQSFIFTASAGEGVSSAQIPDGVVYGVILNDDEGEVVVTPDSYLVASDATAVVEGDSGTVYAEFTVTRSGALGFDGSVNWAVGVTTNSANNANAADFVGGLATGTLAMALGQTSFTIRVPISGDSVMEGDETFKLVLSNPSPGLQVTTGTAFGTISNDDARFDIESAVTAYANAAPITEGTGDSPSQISFTILRTGNTARAMSVNWDVAYRDQDNFGTGDFAGTGFPSGVVNFAAGEESQIVTLDLRTDDRFELDETFRIKLTDSSTGSSIGAATSFFKIMNDDVDVFSLRASTFTQTEGDVAEGFTNFTFTATRLSDDTSATVAWTAVGSGERPLDVQQLMANSGTVSFAIGELSKDFTVSVANNLVGDYDRGFDVRLSEPLIYIPNSTPETTDDPVDAVNGGVIDPDQSYVSATLANDDPVYAVSFTGDGITVEGNGTKGGFVRFLITRAGDSSGETSLNWALSDDGDVKANLSDFGGFWPSGTVLFKDGETEKLVQARISGDTKYEGDETFKVTISEINSSVEGAVILVNTDQGIIKNDDNGVFISAEVSAVYEGENNHPVAFNIGVTGLAYQTVTVQYVIEGYGLNPINAQDIDESSYGAGERTLHTDADGFATDSITVYVMGDTNFGATEGMRLRVTSIVNGSLATNTGMIDIINDDNLVSIARAQNHAPTVSEGNADTVSLTYIVTRKGDTTRAAYFAYEVIGTGDNPAGHWDIEGGFGTFPGYFEPGQTTAEITVQINGDTTFESDESFVIRLVPYNQWPQNNESIADIDASASQITETILNDDSASIRAEALTDSVKEGTLGANTLSYRVIRDGDVSQDLTVSYSLAMDPQNTPWGVPLPANAVVGGLTGTVTILAGQEYADLKLTTVPDADPGRNLAFLLSISAAGFTNPSPISGIIMDDDSGISVALADATASEGDGITLVFTREGSNLGPTDVAWELISRGKETVQVGDFASDASLSGLVSFDQGQTEKTVTIELLDDNWVEGKENFVVRLLSSSNATQLLRTPEIEGAVTDNDTITQGNDDIAMGSGSSRIEALDGDDYVVGGGGADVIFGGDGNDVLVAGTQDFLTRSDGLSGSAQVYGGNGDDIIVFGSSGLIGAGLPTGLFGGDGFDTVAIDIGIGSNQTFDFSAMAQPAQFDSIEMVQISSSASQSNTLKLSAQAMQWQGIDMVIDAVKGLGGGLHQLFIAGQLGDQVQLSDYSDWVLAGPDVALDLSLRYFTEPSYAFNVYTNLSANSQIIVSRAVEVVAGQTQFAPTSAFYVPSQIQIAIDAQGAWEDMNHNGLRDDGATDLALVQSLDHPGLFTIEGISFVDDNVELRFTSQFDTELDMTGAGEGDTILIDLMAESAAWFDYPTGGVFDILDGAVPQLHVVGDAAPYTQGVTLGVFNPENTDVIQIGLVSDPSDAVDQIPYQGLQLASYVADTVEISYVHLQIT